MFLIRRSPVALVALLTSLLGGCSATQEFVLVGTPQAPGLDGVIQIEGIEGGSHLVTVSLTNLLPPGRLAQHFATYVVWFGQAGDNAEGNPVKAGSLQYDEGTRQGSMFATTPLRSFELRITAEPNANVTTPSDAVVARRRVPG